MTWIYIYIYFSLIKPCTKEKKQNKKKLIKCTIMFTINTTPQGLLRLLCLCCPLNFLICHLLLPAVLNISWCKVIRKNNVTALSQQQYYFHSCNRSRFDSCWKGNTQSCVYPFVSFLCCTPVCLPLHFLFTFRCHQQLNEKKTKHVSLGGGWKIVIFLRVILKRVGGY